MKSTVYILTKFQQQMMTLYKNVIEI